MEIGIEIPAGTPAAKGTVNVSLADFAGNPLDDTVLEFAVEGAAQVIQPRVYKAGELVFAKCRKCPCGALLAYPGHVDINSGYWSCSAVLQGIANTKVEHTEKFPFASISR
jgi:hypothetical protein